MFGYSRNSPDGLPNIACDKKPHIMTETWVIYAWRLRYCINSLVIHLCAEKLNFIFQAPEQRFITKIFKTKAVQWKYDYSKLYVLENPNKVI